MQKSLAAMALLAASVGLAAPAGAVIVPFGGAASGTDPLGEAWSTTNSLKPSWGEPGLGSGMLTFNPGHLSSGAGAYATEFDFIFLHGVAGDIDTTPASGPLGFEATTRLSDVTKSELWTTVFVSPKEVHFIAPADSRIDAGDKFFVNVVFTGAVSARTFSFAGLWTDDPVSAPASDPAPDPAPGPAAMPAPEPATMALLGTGLLGLGLARRRRAG